MTTTPVATKQAVRDLSARLAVEYAGAVPPGRVRAYVSRSEQRLRGVALGYASRLELIETCVRQQLAEAAARPPQRTSGLVFTRRSRTRTSGLTEATWRARFLGSAFQNSGGGLDPMNGRGRGWSISGAVVHISGSVSRVCRDAWAGPRHQNAGRAVRAVAAYSVGGLPW